MSSSLSPRARLDSLRQRGILSLEQYLSEIEQLAASHDELDQGGEEGGEEEGGEEEGGAELSRYLAGSLGAPVLDTSSVEDFTKALLKWWNTNGNSFPAWAHAAKIAFAISPNSAACERVFALLKTMFGDEQMSALGDILRSSLMLRYNARRLG